MAYDEDLANRIRELVGIEGSAAAAELNGVRGLSGRGGELNGVRGFRNDRDADLVDH